MRICKVSIKKLMARGRKRNVPDCPDCPKDEMWGFHFNKNIIKKLSDIGLDIDIDLYADGNDLE
jgi:hypothetical protein